MAKSTSVGTVHIPVVYDLEDLGAKVTKNSTSGLDAVQKELANALKSFNRASETMGKRFVRQSKIIESAMNRIAKSVGLNMAEIEREVDDTTKKSTKKTKTETEKQKDYWEDLNEKIRKESKETMEALIRNQNRQTDNVKRNTGTQIRTAEKETDKATSGIGSSLMMMGKAAIAAFAVREVWQFGSACVELGSDLREVQNVVDTVFPNMREQINEWSKNAINTAGLSETMAKQFSGTFGTMAKAMGVSEKASYSMSTSLAQLSGDVASFYNISQEEAFTKLKGIFTGESEALKSLGVIMTQTALDQYAMNQGWGKTTAKMTEQEKVMLRYQYVMSALGSAQGDFAKTSGGWANQTRMLNLQFEQLKATIGQGLINALTPVLQVLNQLLARLQTVASAFAKLTGKIFGEATTEQAGAVTDELGYMSDGLDGVTDSANGAKKALGALSIDSFNKLGSSASAAAGSASASIAGIGSGTIALPTVDTTKQQGQVGKLTEKVQELWKEVKETKYWQEFCEDLDKNWEEYGPDLEKKLDKFWKLFQDDITITYKIFTKPILEKLGTCFDDLWEGSLRTFFDECGMSFGEFGNWLLDMLNRGLENYHWWMETFGPGLTKLVSGVIDNIILRLNGFINWWSGLLTFLRGVFTLDLGVALEGIRRMFTAMFQKIGIDVEDYVTAMFNHCIDNINKMIRIINALFKTSLKPIAYVGNTEIKAGLAVSGATMAASLPKLASGAYFEPHTPTAAIVGEGNDSEFVAPEKKLREAVGSELDNRMSRLEGLMMELIQATKENKPIDRPIQLDGRTVTKTVNKTNKTNETRKGK